MERKFPDQARVVIIGGGVIGASLLYHLCELGCSDSVLLERTELSSGTTWGSSALLSYFTGSPLITRLHLETLSLYRKVEAETGQSVGYHETGSLRLAESQERFTEYVRAAAMVRHFGVPCELVTASQLKQLHPLLNTDGLIGAAYTSQDGYVDPSSVTQALAQAARKAGGIIVRHAPVRSLRRLRNGEWEVTSDQGTIRCEMVVNAGGMWAPHIGKMLGLYHPVIAFERQYFVTEDIAFLETLEHPLPVLRDPQGTFYAREEVGGILVGPYERKPRFWGLDEISEAFSHQSLPGYLDNASEPLEAAMLRLPILETTGIRAVVNVPTSRTPDANPLVGPVRGMPNYFVAAGFFGGISQSSLCRYLAQLLLAGESEIDLSPFDPRRFADYSSRRYAIDRIRPRHIVGLVQAVGYPDEEPEGARPTLTSPIYDAERSKGAVFGVRSGWEVALWFSTRDTDAKSELSFRRASWFARVGEECASIRDAVGLADVTAMTKLEISGRDAASLLDELFAAPLPKDLERTRGAFLTESGRILAVADVLRLGSDHFYITTSVGKQSILTDWLEKHGTGKRVSVTAFEERCILRVIGAKATPLISDLAEGDLSQGAFPSNSLRRLHLGYAPVLAVRSGDHGVECWDIHLAPMYQRGLYELLTEEGRRFDLRPVGLRALQSLRLADGILDSYGTLDLLEAGLDRTANGKQRFLGSVCLSGAPKRRLAKLRLDAEDADALGGEPVFSDGRSISLVSQGGYDHLSKESLAYVILPLEKAAPGTELAVEVLGKRLAAVVQGPVLQPVKGPSSRAIGRRSR